MNDREYDRMFELEDQYWWFVGRRRLALQWVESSVPSQAPILDFGCGTGVVMSELARRAPVVGIDMSEKALRYCKSRDLTNLVQARGEHVPLQSGTFGGVVALDIFEHIEDDSLAFREAFRLLQPGGALVLSVPAFQSLWGPHDVALHHFRRYTRHELRSKLEKAGFRVERCSYAVFFLFPIVLAIRVLEKRRKDQAKASLPAVPAWANRFLIGLQTFEGRLVQKVTLPWGSSVVAIARKP